MAAYIIRYKDADGKEVEVKVPGKFALWREDAGFYSEALDHSRLKEISTATSTILADEEGVTSITFINISDDDS